MQGIYTYIPVPNHVPRDCSVAGILLLLFMVHVMLFPMLNPLYCTFPYHITSLISSFVQAILCFTSVYSVIFRSWWLWLWVTGPTLSCLVAVANSVSRYSWCFHSWFPRIAVLLLLLLLLYSLCCWPLGLLLSTLINKNCCIIIIIINIIIIKPVRGELRNTKISFRHCRSAPSFQQFCSDIFKELCQCSVRVYLSVCLSVCTQFLARFSRIASRNNRRRTNWRLRRPATL